MKHIKFLKSHPKYGYFAGDEAQISIKAADELIGSGHVEEVKAKAAKTAEEPKETAKTHKK